MLYFVWPKHFFDIEFRSVEFGLAYSTDNVLGTTTS